MESNLNFHWSEENFKYEGPELRPHFLLTQFGLRGSSIFAAVGPCEVQTQDLVDWEDRLASDFIRAQSMVHFLGEFFGMSLREGVLLQRLMVSTVGEVLSRHLDETTFRVTREGDDLFIDKKDQETKRRKLTVSIVTASPVSQLLHLGVNVDPSGSPVPAIGLFELGISPQTLVSECFESFDREWKSLNWACTKVRPVV